MITSLVQAKKSGFRAALLLCLVFFGASIAFAKESPINPFPLLVDEKISQSPVWLSLLHSDGKTSAIADAEFVLSAPHFSPHAEMLATIRYLYDGTATHVCRFPARYVWLKTQLNLPALSLSPCDDLNEFVHKVPNQKISLIFASESLAQPASMMGHSFLRLSGQKEDGSEASHAVTFFTEAEGYNLPKLFLQSTILGKQGFFALLPFEEELDRYLKKEQRNVWFYDLKLDDATRQLIQYHLQELKQTNLIYFFQSYNCATLLRHVIALSGQLKPPSFAWVSPKDVVQDATQAGLVEFVSVDSPSAWLVRALEMQLPAKENDEITKTVRAGNSERLVFKPESDVDYLRFSLAQTYADYLATQQPENTAYSDAAKSLFMRGLYADKKLQTAPSLNPATSPPDSQLSFSALGTGQNQKYRFSFLPASHLLGDDNSAYTQETELQLLGVSASVDRNQRLALDRLTLYKMQSHTPYSPLIGGLSSKFLLQWGGSTYQAPDADKGWTSSVALGRTYQLSRDVDVFGLFGLGFAATKQGRNLPATTELGAIVREIGQMKTVFSYERRHDLRHQAIVTDYLQIEQSKYWDRHSTLFARFRQSPSGPIRFKEWEIGLKQLF